MEKLKKALRENIIFDYHNDGSGEDFKTVLFDELDRLGIYASDNRQFFNIDPETVIHLSLEEGFKIDIETTIDDIVREARQNLAFNYMYGVLYCDYLEKYEG